MPESKVKGPAIALIITAAIGIAWNLFNLVSTAIQPAPTVEDLKEQQRQQGQPVSPQGDKALEWGAKLGKPVAIVWALLGIGICALILFAAIQMMKLKGRGLAITASILSFIPLNMCCALTLPFGIWALVVLNNAEVKAAFQGIRPGGGEMGMPGQMPPQ